MVVISGSNAAASYYQSSHNNNLLSRPSIVFHSIVLVQSKLNHSERIVREKGNSFILQVAEAEINKGQSTCLALSSRRVPHKKDVDISTQASGIREHLPAATKQLANNSLFDIFGVISRDTGRHCLCQGFIYIRHSTVRRGEHGRDQVRPFTMMEKETKT